MGLRVYETFGFQGLDKVAEEKERQGWRVCGEVGGGGSSSLYKPVHSKDRPFNLQSAAWILMLCGVHCGPVDLCALTVCTFD